MVGGSANLIIHLFLKIKVDNDYRMAKVTCSLHISTVDVVGGRDCLRSERKSMLSIEDLLGPIRV